MPKDVSLEVDLAVLTHLMDQRLDFAQVQQLAPAALAYLGDAVYELYVRTRLVWPPKRSKDYHHQAVAQVKATYQAQIAKWWMDHLTAPEKELWRRGRNAAVRRSNRVDHAIYQAATGVETLIGYLYLTNPQRLEELMHHLPPIETNPASEV